MAKKPEPALSRRERQIMDVIYAKGQATALTVLEALPDPPSKAAIRTLLSILEDKGHLAHRQDGQTYIYYATRPRAHAGRSALQRVLDVFYGGSLEQAVAAHLTEQPPTADELRRIAKLIGRARKTSGGA